MVSARHADWFSKNEQAVVPETYAAYRTQVVHAAFLLGYSYTEAFVADLAREIFRCHPRMLPKKKKLRFVDVLNNADYEGVLEHMIEKEIRGTFSQSMEKIIKYFDNKLGLVWPSGEAEQIVRASCLRNCIIHNMARVDAEMAKVGHYKVGDRIELQSGEIHSMGLRARSVARSLYAQADKKFFSNTSITN